MYALLYGNTDCALALIDSPHDEHGATVLENGFPVSVNLCGESVTRQIDRDGRSTLFYALYAANYDEPATVVENDKTIHIPRDTYSARYGANKCIDTLLKLRCGLPSNARTAEGRAGTAEEALRLAAEIGDMQILWKVMKNCTSFKDALIRYIPQVPAPPVIQPEPVKIMDC